jgi:hypothetical protein
MGQLSYKMDFTKLKVLARRCYIAVQEQQEVFGSRDAGQSRGLAYNVRAECERILRKV